MGIVELNDISVMADYAIFRPEFFTSRYVVSEPDMRMIRGAMRDYNGPGSLQGKSELLSGLKRGVFAAIVELYGNTPMTSIQMKRLTQTVVSCNDPAKLVVMYVAVHYTVEDMWDMVLKDDYIEKIIKSSDASWFSKLIIRYRTKKLSDESRHRLKLVLRNALVDGLIETYSDKNSECYIHVPDPYSMAHDVAYYNDGISGLTACIKDYPGRVYDYYLHYRLAERLRRWRYMEKTKMPTFLYDREMNLINEARVIMMLCTTVRRQGEEGVPEMSAIDIAGALDMIYDDEGELRDRVYEAFLELKALGYCECIPPGYGLPEPEWGERCWEMISQKKEERDKKTYGLKRRD